jgi:oxygen-independent coproporphyrinogen-3 oxidase
LAETVEELSATDRLNEYIMTALRTMWGIDLDKVSSSFDIEQVNQISKQIQPFVDKGLATIDKKNIVLTQKGKLFADGIAAELFTENY